MKTHDYIHYCGGYWSDGYRRYWSDGRKCRIRIYQEQGESPVVICSQLTHNDNTSVTNMAQYLAADVIEGHGLATPLAWIEHYPEHEGGTGEYSLERFSYWERREVYLGGVCRGRIGPPLWSSLPSDELKALIDQQAGGQSLLSAKSFKEPYRRKGHLAE